MFLKSNKDAYKKQNRKERELNRLAKHRNSFAINHPHLDQKPSQTSCKRYIEKNPEKCLPAEDILTQPDDVEASLRIKDTLQFHMIKRFFDEHNVSYLQFFKMATNEKPLFTQFYGERA